MSSEQHHPRPRIESLTDLIFGLALSIGAVGLLNYRPTTAQDIALSVGFFFFFGFLILITDAQHSAVALRETAGTRTTALCRRGQEPRSGKWPALTET